MKTRRDFLRTVLLGASATWTVPLFVDRTFAQLHDQARDLATQPVTGKDGTILVVLQLAGGNDGLNTLVPHGNDTYHRLRPKLAKKSAEILKLDDLLGLNASMPFLHSLYQNGNLGIVQGVGYPNPNRSHFVSTSIWETADPATRTGTGWIGRYFDHACSGADPTVGISLGKTQPEAFGALRNPGIALTQPELYRWLHSGGRKAQAEELFAKLNSPTQPDTAQAGPAPDSNLEFLQRVALDARASSKTILETAAKHRSTVHYDGSPIARSLNLVSRMIAGGLPTRVFYVSHGGFDTHNHQLGSHDRLLGQLDSALKSFFTDLRQQGNDQRVVVMTFSEFGRRVAENASAGTDHGKASCLFVAGPAVQGGLYGSPPDFSQLDDGDLRHTVDFRSVYATLLSGWLRAPDSQAILKGEFSGLPFLRA
jgi:uncharacterized protein (DUF1501 family)